MFIFRTKVLIIASSGHILHIFSAPQSLRMFTSSDAQHPPPSLHSLNWKYKQHKLDECSFENTKIQNVLYCQRVFKLIVKWKIWIFWLPHSDYVMHEWCWCGVAVFYLITKLGNWLYFSFAFLWLHLMIQMKLPVNHQHFNS